MGKHYAQVDDFKIIIAVNYFVINAKILKDISKCSVIYYTIQYYTL